MTNRDILQKARQRLDVLERERQELENFVRTYEKLSADEGAPIDEASPTVARAKASRREIVDAALEALSDARKPMTLSALFEAVTARGLKIGGKIPKNNLGAMLSAEPRICTRPGRGWWFRDEDYPRDLDEYDEGPADEAARPCLSNGAAGSSPA